MKTLVCGATFALLLSVMTGSALAGGFDGPGQGPWEKTEWSDTALAGGAEARSFSRNGGYSESHAYGEGDAQVRSFGSAVNGGYARAVGRGYGYHGGFADVLSTAAADQGYADSEAVGVARHSGFVESTGHAATIGGRALARDYANAYGNADALSHTTALSFGGDARGFGESHARGYHGRAVSRNVSHAETWHGRAVSDSRALSNGYFGNAFADSHGVSINNGYPTFAQSRADAYGEFGGTARAVSEHRVIRWR